MTDKVEKLPDPAPETDAAFPAGSWQRLATWFITGGLLCALASPFAAHLWFAPGVWPKVEPTIILVHSGAALCAAGLLISCIVSGRFAAGSIRHPVIIIAAGIALWSIALAPAARYPLLSITGSPQIADGALLWLDIAVFIAGARLLHLVPRNIEILGFAVLFAAVALPVLAWFPTTRGIWFNDHLAFLGIAAAVTVPEALRSRFAGPHSRFILAVLAGMPALLVSQNFSAFGILAVICLPVYVATDYIRRTRSDNAVSITRVFVAAIVGIGALGAPFAIKWFGALDVMGSMQSRAHIIEALSNHIAGNPLTLLIGNGWGHTEQLFAESLADVQVTIWDKSWDAAWRDIFHSHNLVLEALLSAGLPAAIAVAAFSAALPLYGTKRMLPAAAAYTVGFIGIASVWFQMPGTVPYTALAVAMLTGRPEPVSRSGTVRLCMIPALATVMAVQLTVASTLGMFSWRYFQLERALAFQAGTGTGPAVRCGSFPPEGWRGDTGLALQFIKSYDTVIAPAKGHIVTASDIETLDYYACTAGRRGIKNQSRAVLRASLLFRAQLAYNAKFAPHRDRLERYIDDWDEQVRMFLKLEPKRTDLIYPFLSWNLLQNKYSTVLAITQTVLAQNRHDAISLWFRGLALFQRGYPQDRNQALQYLQEGLQQDIEKWFSIPAETKSMIRGNGITGK